MFTVNANYLHPNTIFLYFRGFFARVVLLLSPGCCQDVVQCDGVEGVAVRGGAHFLQPRPSYQTPQLVPLISRLVISAGKLQRNYTNSDYVSF